MAAPIRGSQVSGAKNVAIETRETKSVLGSSNPLTLKLEAAIALLEAGADPQHGNNEGRIPSWTARNRGNDDVADLLDTTAGDYPTRNAP
jgi:hypothetical protein